MSPAHLGAFGEINGHFDKYLSLHITPDLATVNLAFVKKSHSDESLEMGRGRAGARRARNLEQRSKSRRMRKSGFSVFDWQAAANSLYFNEKEFLAMRAMDPASGRARFSPEQSLRTTSYLPLCSRGSAVSTTGPCGMSR